MKDLPLGADPRDRAKRLYSELISLFPVVGPPLAGLLTELLPEYRQERAENYLRHLAERLAQLEEKQQEVLKIIARPENADLIEEGGLRSLRALTEERIKQITRLVTDGISEDKKKSIEAKRFLRLLSEIDDEQIVILMSYLSPTYLGDQTKRNIPEKKRAFIGAPQENFDHNTARNLAYSQLIRLGLLDIKYPPNKISVGLSDEKMFEKYGCELSPLGRLLLSRIS